LVFTQSHLVYFVQLQHILVYIIQTDQVEYFVTS